MAVTLFREKNVERAVKMLCDGKFRPPPKRIRKGRNKAIRQLRHLREIRLKSEEYFHVKDVTVDAPSVFRQPGQLSQEAEHYLGRRSIILKGSSKC